MVSKNLDRSIPQRFEWEVPHIPGDKNVFVTASRMQHAPQAYRLWILPQLFQAATFDELAEQLYGLLIEGEKSRIPSEKWFRKLFLDKKSGLFTLGKIHTFIKRLKGRMVKEEVMVKREFTKKDIGHQIMFYKKGHTSKDAINYKNEMLFKIALANFDRISKTVYIDSNGNAHKHPQKTYKELDAIPVRNTYIALKFLQAIANKTHIQPVFGIGDFNEICDQLGIPLQKQTSKGIKEILASRTEKKLFNAKTIYITRPEDAYRAERIVEIAYIIPGKVRSEQKNINPSDARYILDQTFSLVGRSAGGRLAGAPLTTLHRDIQGVKINIIRNIDDEIRVKYIYGKYSGENTFSIKKRRVRVGQPYTDRMIQASKLVTQVIDAVGRRLDEYVQKYRTSKKMLFSVEKLSEYALGHIITWFGEKNTLSYNGRRSRTHQNMDFFFLPDKEIRKKIIEDTQKNNGYISDPLKKLLQNETLKGMLQLGILDISAGAGTTGLSEFIAKLLNYRESGSMNAYINSMVTTFESKYDRKPNSIIICPRAEDLTLTATEYIPAVEEIRRWGIKAEIVLAEQLEKSLRNWDGKSRFATTTWDGRTIIPELVAKRFTFLGAGLNNDKDRGYIRAKLPPGMEIIPSPSSRIPASEKRINSKILELLKPELEKLRVVIIPTKAISLVSRTKMEMINDTLKKATGQNKVKLQGLKNQYVKQSIQNAVEDIIAFVQDNRAEWPEIEFLGLILKLDDKRPGRVGKGGELVSTYPIPAGILKIAIHNNKLIAEGKIPNDLEKCKEYLDEIVTHRILDLIDKGVCDIIIQPNLLTIFSDGKDFMETKLFVYAKPIEEEIDGK